MCPEWLPKSVSDSTT